ncbi:MAG: glucokinase, partial [Pedobacter sp.]|nr:glucokinase [Chitinophagaceae bacterium]
KDYTSIDIVIKQFLVDNKSLKPTSICIGAAGPVSDNKVTFTNLSWVVDGAEIAKQTGIKNVAIINDLEATAYGIACLAETDFYIIQNGNKTTKGNIAIIAPGTGLGEAGMYFDGRHYHPFATEGGHSEFSPRTAVDIELLQYLQQQNHIISWEYLVSGPGTFSIYQFLRDIKNMEEPKWLSDALSTGDKAATISKAAIENKADICTQTMQLFVKYLAQETANLVLKFKATGGVFLGGGIPPKILPLLKQTLFIDTFKQSDRMQDLIDATPVKVVLNDQAALLGAAYFALFSFND